MANPRSLVYALYNHWDTVEVLVRLSREFAVLTTEQVLGCIAKVAPQLDAEAQGAALRAMVNADILQPCARSSDLQLNAHVLDFVRGLTREHELGLAAVLQARVAAIREATEALNEGMQAADMDRTRGAANKLAELFRQISLQLDQDRHALLELAEDAKSADASMPIAQRYRRVLEAYDHYVEPMNQMMDTGPQGTFYRYLEDAERSLDLAFEQLSVQGGLYSHRLQLRQVAHQAKELRRFGRLIAQQCADTVLPLREETDQQRQYDPLAALYTLLEPRSARDFIDLSIRDFAIDASHVNWIATANSIEGIPAPLLSRMTVLHVQAPTPAQVAHIARQIYGRMRAESPWGSGFAPTLDDQVVDKLKNLPPRTLGLALKRALGRAAREERDHIQVCDLPALNSSPRKAMGFVA